MKHTFFSCIIIAMLASCNNNENSNGNSGFDSTANNTKTGKDTSAAVPDSVIGGSGYTGSGNTASGNSNAGNLNTDTIPTGAGRNRMPDSIKAKVEKQKADSTNKPLKHH